ncbi:MAG: methylated-DNA--[protein]-cysteine S-methyltransferase [Thermodesulfovibrionales bacterium]|jgi:methylated-DNA-[protein]-cysteine S-methyltransferase
MEFCVYHSPIGEISCLLDEGRLVELTLRGDLCDETPGKGTEGLKKELDLYFSGELTEFRQEIRFLQGTPFERAVWLSLREIPCGETRSYRWIAERVGRPKAARAVGQALRKNPLPVILPCHRVICSNGGLGGYVSGLDHKKWLLKHEGAL